MENTQLHSTLPFAKSTWTDTDTQKHHFLAFGDTGPIQKTPIRTGESSLANASGPVVDLGLRAQRGSPRCRDSPPFSVPTGPSPPRTPRFNSPPQSRQTRRAQATRYLPETRPGPKMWAIAPGLDSRNCSRCQGVVMFFASSPTIPNPAGPPPDTRRM